VNPQLVLTDPKIPLFLGISFVGLRTGRTRFKVFCQPGHRDRDIVEHAPADIREARPWPPCAPELVRG